MAELNTEITAYETMQKELEATHMAEWVLLHDQQLIGLYPSFQEAAENAVEKFGRGPYLIRQIGAPPVILPASVMYHPIYAENDMRLQ